MQQQSLKNLTNGSTEQIRHLALQLLAAIDGCPAPVQLGKHIIRSGSRAKTKASKAELQRIIQNKFNKKYFQ